MQIEVKTSAYAEDKNYNAIADAIQASGYKWRLSLSGRHAVDGVVTITTDAPLSILDGVGFTKSAVTIRA